MTVRVRSVPPCVSSQIGSRHLLLKQGIVSSSLTWRTSSIGVWCNASIRVLGTRGDSSILSSPTNCFSCAVFFVDFGAHVEYFLALDMFTQLNPEISSPLVLVAEFQREFSRK